MSELSRININNVNYDLKDDGAVAGARYNSTIHNIEFLNALGTVVATLDATPFIKDGMVSDVKIENGNLVIVFNTDSGKQPISIPLTDIFNPDNYYTKTQVDGKLALKYEKPSGGIPETDMTVSVQEKLGKAATAVQPTTLAIALKNTVAESGVYDVTVNNSGTEFASLSAILSSAQLDTLIPENVRKGGMSIKFVRSSDNKYVQYLLTKDEWSASEGDWEKTNLEEELNQLTEKVVKKIGGSLPANLEIEQGLIVFSSGVESSSSNTIRTSDYIVCNSVSIKTNGSKVGVIGYKSDGTYVSSPTVWYTTSQVVKIDGADKYRFNFRNAGGTNITPADFNSLSIKIDAVFEDKTASKEDLDEVCEKIDEIDTEVNGLVYEDSFTISTTGEHSSNLDRITFPSTIPAGSYTFKVETGTTGNSGYVQYYVKYTDSQSTTAIGNGSIGSATAVELTSSIESIGIYMSATVNQHTGNMPLTIKSVGLKEYVKELYSKRFVTYGLVRCGTAGDVANKVITIPKLEQLNNGESVRFLLLFTNPTSVNASLVVNNEDSKPLYYNGARAGLNNTWAKEEVLDVYYNINYPAYFATTHSILGQVVNESSPSKTKTVSEAGIVDYAHSNSKDVYLYNEDKLPALVSAVSRSPLVYEKLSNNQCFAFSILTDLHSDILRFKRACAYADSISDIEATFCLGDMIHSSNSNNPYPLILDYTKAIIPITGNHEVLKNSNASPVITGWDEEALLTDMYSSDLVSHNGETHPEGKCYWYKDFTKTIDSTTKKLRVIGLHQYESNGTGEQNTGSGKDVTFYSQAQIDWLIARLEECDANTMVMILMHYAPTNAMTKISSAFTPSDRFNFPISGGSITGGSSSMSDDLFIPKIVQAWIDGTTLNISCDITVGETVTTITAVKNTAFAAHDKQFAGYFTGHTHRDMVCKITDYPKQTVFSFICSSTGAQNQCDVGRSTTGKAQDCFTIVSIDWFTKSVNLIRIGADVTTDMRERKYANYLL